MEINYNDIVDKSKIIDIRSKLDYEENNIGTINIPRLILLSSPDSFINKIDEYYLLCDRGLVSMSCARILNALGYKCYSIKGGIKGI
jgi:rhodanese-related sulfurtransferase